MELEEKTRLINQVLELQHTLEGNSTHTHTQSFVVDKVFIPLKRCGICLSSLLRQNQVVMPSVSTLAVSPCCI